MVILWFHFLTDDILHNLGTIEPKAEVKYVLDMTGTKLGGYMITAGLSSDKVEHVTGELEVRMYVALLGMPGIGHAQTGDMGVGQSCKFKKATAQPSPLKLTCAVAVFTFQICLNPHSSKFVNA